MELNGNELIEIREFLLDQLRDISLQEWRLLGYYLCKIDPRDCNTRYVRIALEDYCELLDLGEDINVPYLKKSSGKLCRIIIDAKDPDKHIVYSQVPLFQRSRLVDDDSGNYFFELNASDDCLPLMFDFKEHYITAKGMNIFSFNSPKQVLMYFLLRKQVNLGRRDFEISVEELRHWLGVNPDEYSEWCDFKKRILDTCQTALNAYSDLSFQYEKGKKGAHGKLETLLFNTTNNRENAKRFEKQKLLEKVKPLRVINITEDDKIIEYCQNTFRKTLNGIELGWIGNWTRSLKYKKDLVVFAIDCNKYRERMTMKNIDDTLNKWHDNGITTVEEAQSFCEKEYNENKRNAARKKNGGQIMWHTGAEVGIGTEIEDKNPIESVPAASDEEPDTSIPTDILDMFGEGDIDI